MKVEFEYATNTGRVRLRNEDALLVNDHLISSISMSNPKREIKTGKRMKFLVADGLGGLPCGETASRLALEYFKGRFTLDPEEIRYMLECSSTHLLDYSKREGECFGMATALAGVFLEGEKGLVFNVGDCRVYLQRNGNLTLLTRDHTSAFELYEEGSITFTELREHPLRNFLTSTVMAQEGETPEVYAKEIDVKEGDIFLICSDGLWDEICEERIRDTLELPLEEAGNCLFSTALKNGRDNVSFIIVRVLSGQQSQ